MNKVRVVKTTTSNFNTISISEDVIWEGADIMVLSRKFPKSNVWGADQLGRHEIEDGFVHWDHRFERGIGENQWSQIKDPRVEVYDPEHAALESAIEAENRHLYPGDYDNGYSDEENWDDDDNNDPYCDDNEDLKDNNTDESAESPEYLAYLEEAKNESLYYDFRGGWRTSTEITELKDLLGIINDIQQNDMTADEFKVVFHGKFFYGQRL